ncbi:MAG: divalent-cation tolerance protein CutA [Nanoarchaeota archaeon]
MTMMVYVTCKDLTEARYISSHLLESKLVACSNFFPVQSMYSWKGEIVEEAEYVIIMKSVKKNFDRIKREILKTHSADVPCIVSYEIKEGHEDYLKWLKKSVE